MAFVVERRRILIERGEKNNIMSHCLRPHAAARL